MSADSDFRKNLNERLFQRMEAENGLLVLLHPNGCVSFLGLLRLALAPFGARASSWPPQVSSELKKMKSFEFFFILVRVGMNSVLSEVWKKEENVKRRGECSMNLVPRLTPLPVESQPLVSRLATPS